MAENQKVTVEGINQLVRALKKAEQTELLAQLKQANTESGNLVVTAARPMVPVKTGNLLGSLRSNATERQAIVRAGKKKVPYAGVIHFGWPKRGIEPQPFLFKALDQRRQQVVTTYEQALDRLVRTINSETL